MSLKTEIDKLKFDKRMIDWNLSRGRLSKEELDKYLSALPDSATNVANFELQDNGMADRDMFGTSQDEES